MSRWQIRFSDYHLLIKYPQASEIARIEMMLADEENKRLENSLWALDFADWINPVTTLRLPHHQLISGLSGGLKTSEGDTITSLSSWSFSGCTSLQSNSWNFSPPTPDQVFGYKGGVGPYLPESQRKGCWGWEEKEGKGKGLILCFFTTINDMNKSGRCMIK